MVVMGIAVKVAVGLVLLLPMTGYVVGSLVAAADPPREHAPIIVQEQTQSPDKPRQSPSDKPSKKPSDKKSERGDDHGGEDPGDDDTPEVITPSPDDLFDDNGGDDDNSGKGSGGDDDDSSGKGSGHD